MLHILNYHKAWDDNKMESLCGEEVDRKEVALGSSTVHDMCNQCCNCGADHIIVSEGKDSK
jgi:hypothetical protein